MPNRTDELCKKVAERVTNDIGSDISKTQMAMGQHRHQPWCKWRCANTHRETQINLLEGIRLNWLMSERVIKMGYLKQAAPTLNRLIEHFKPSPFMKYVMRPAAPLGNHIDMASIYGYFEDYHAMLELREICRAS